ncbi:integrase arm-type DNA-binding domain-containing protein, partial [Desulfovibrio sp. OttesenSCG-928-M14]|nr:integrase arm-type DNA-binding domain-containing protein [Desulfovibrio sp. OttesenSCG-928-M14]
MPLTDTAIKAFKPKDKPYREFDGGGMYLEITPKGAKLWRLKYRFGSKEKRLSFGAYPTIGLKEAREYREQAKKLLSQGIDPGEVKKEAKAAAAAIEQEQATTFEAVAREWFAKKKVAWTLGHQKKILSRLENQLFPHIGSKLFSELEPADFLAAIQKAEARGAIETAHRLAQLSGQVSRYARLAGHTRYDVAAGLTEALTPVQVNHYAAITDPAQVGHLLCALDGYQGDITIQYALRILPYVFVRSGELRGALWSEIDMEAAEWTIPASRMKMKRLHIVPLARQVVKLLCELQPVTGDGAFVFPSMQSRGRHISDMGLLNALRRLGYGKGEMTVHGFRSMASTILNEQGYRPDVIEAALAHGEKNAIRAAYNRAE